MSEYLYYPGCSLEGSARAYAQSVAAVVAPLGIELHELNDWNCCGATEYLTLSPLRGHALIARNLAIAERQRNGTETLVAPCSACYVNLARTDRFFREGGDFPVRVNTALAADGLHYDGGAVRVRHLLEVIVDDVGLERVAALVKRPLSGLRVAPYLGCLVSRPDYDRRWDEHEQTRALDRLLAALGAEVVDYPLRTACCGGHMTQINPDTAWELIRRLVEAADHAHTDVMATVCPMCQMNVDAYQGEMDRHYKTRYRVPILFFTQLMGLAFGIEPRKLGIGSEVVSPKQALSRIGVEVPTAEAEEPAPTAGHAKRPKRPQGLPMPAPLESER